MQLNDDEYGIPITYISAIKNSRISFMFSLGNAINKPSEWRNLLNHCIKFIFQFIILHLN